MLLLSNLSNDPRSGLVNVLAPTFFLHDFNGNLTIHQQYYLRAPSDCALTGLPRSCGKALKNLCFAMPKFTSD